MEHEHLVMPDDHMDELYNAKNPLVRFVHRGRLRAITDHFPRGARLKVFDAGCGEGHLLAALHERYPSHEYHGADATPIALTRARARCPFAAFSRADLLFLAYPDASFDVVIATEVLEHIFNYRAALRELIRILKPGGTLILTFPNEILWTVSRFFLGRRPIKVPDHVNSFTPRRVCEVVGLPLRQKINLPFRLPFALSLTGMLIFKKKNTTENCRG